MEKGYFLTVCQPFVSYVQLSSDNSCPDEIHLLFFMLLKKIHAIPRHFVLPCKHADLPFIIVILSWSVSFPAPFSLFPADSISQHTHHNTVSKNCYCKYMCNRCRKHILIFLHNQKQHGYKCHASPTNPAQPRLIILLLFLLGSCVVSCDQPTSLSQQKKN